MRVYMPIIIVLVLMGIAGLACAVIGVAFSDTDKMSNTPIASAIFSGGVCLFAGSAVSGAFIQLIRTQRVPDQRSFWSSRVELLDRSQRPVLFWAYAIMFPLLAASMFVMSALSFLGYW